MPILQLVADGGEQVNGPLRICHLHLGDEMDVLPTDSHLPEAHPGEPGTDNETERMAEQKTVIVVELTHKGELPQNMAEAIERRAYDLAATKGLKVDVSSRVWYALEVKEQ